MKYSIESLGHVKRNRWFINKEFGISVNYYWQDETAQATFETSLIEEGCEDEWSDLVNSIENVETEEEIESLEIEIDYPAPWYFWIQKERQLGSFPSLKKLFQRISTLLFRQIMSLIKRPNYKMLTK